MLVLAQNKLDQLNKNLSLITDSDNIHYYAESNSGYVYIYKVNTNLPTCYLENNCYQFNTNLIKSFSNVNFINNEIESYKELIEIFYG